MNAKARTIALRAADGRTGVVNVGEAVYDLSKLKAGDKVRVDFIAPDTRSSKLSEALIRPEKQAGRAAEAARQRQFRSLSL
jgi:hypothetical protein